MVACCNLKVFFIVLVCSTVFFIVSLVLAFAVFPDVLYHEINKATTLKEGTDQFDRFIDIPFPFDFKAYIFHVNNPDEIMKGAKPNITEIGPYVYKEYKHKTIVEKNDEEDTISFTQTVRFEFDAEASGDLTEDDVVTVLNPALMSIYQLAEDFFMAGAVDKCIKQTFPEGYGEMFIKVPVRRLMFEGVSYCKNTATDMCALVNDIVCAIASTKRNSDVMPDYSLTFSFLNYKKKTHDGKFTIKRGLDNPDTLGHIMAWNDMKYTNYWGKETTCSRVKGTDSTLYPPRVTKDSKFYIFATDICRFVEIDYIGEGTYQDIDGYMFGTSHTTLQPTTENPEDDCYCSKLSKDVNGTKSCFLDGIIDMQTCFGVPVLFSFPHFLWADPKYQEGVIGLNPQEDKHKIFLLVEPNTGTPLQGVKRIQLNAAIRPITGIKSTAEMTRVVLPLLWIEEGVALTPKYIDELRSSYFDKVKLLEGFKWTLIAISAVLVVAFGGLVIYKKFFNKSYSEDM